MQPCIKTMVWFVLVYHDLFFANYSICFSATSEIVTKKSPLRGPGLSIWNNGTGGSKAAYAFRNIRSLLKQMNLRLTYSLSSASPDNLWK